VGEGAGFAEVCLVSARAIVFVNPNLTLTLTLTQCLHIVGVSNPIFLELALTLTLTLTLGKLNPREAKDREIVISFENVCKNMLLLVCFA